MGQNHSTWRERVRYRQLERLTEEAWKRVKELRPAATAEKTAGIPPLPGSKQARHRAAIDYALLLGRERDAISARIMALISGASDIPKMPEPTPSWEEVEATRSVAEPSTPAGSGSPVRWPRGRSSDEAAVPAGDVHLSETARLLPDRAAQPTSGLRRRQGREEAPP